MTFQLARDAAALREQHAREINRRYEEIWGEDGHRPTLIRKRPTIRLAEPGVHAHWTGRRADLSTARDWPYPEMMQTPDGRWWYESVDCHGWFNAGYIPRGRNRWQRWWQHWHHGRLMRYPLASVLAFCVRDQFRRK